MVALWGHVPVQLQFVCGHSAQFGSGNSAQLQFGIGHSGNSAQLGLDKPLNTHTVLGFDKQLNSPMVLATPLGLAMF